MKKSSWAQLIIELLIAQGADYFCCAPGSRSSPLLMAIAKHPLAKHLVHFDERGLGFHAVGYSKATKNIAVVVVTSGTAVGNLLPALMEADQDEIPLILLTADRPPELQQCGANQTCDQVKLFSNCVRWQVDLPCADAALSASYLGSTISYGVMRARALKGPVHINCQLRESFFAQGPYEKKDVVYSYGKLTPSQEDIENWAEKLGGIEKGVLLAGSGSEGESLFTLAEKLQWPVVADILSPLRSHAHPLLLSHHDLILKVKTDETIEAVVHLGNRFVSKTLDLWLQKQQLTYYLQVSDSFLRHDPSHRVTHRVQTSPSLFVQSLSHALPYKEPTLFCTAWQRWNTLAEEGINTFFSNHPSLSELSVIASLPSFLSSEWALFLGNSMPIRDANQLLSFKKSVGPLFANRGVSGIDGNIATAAGIAQGCEKNTCVVLGDLALLHDLNSLALLKNLKYAIVIYVINNGGGGIFSFLPFSEKKEHLEKFIAASHGVNFKAAAALFNLPYFHPQTQEEFETVLIQQRKEPTTCLIEITTNREENLQIHHQLQYSVATCLTEKRPLQAVK